MNGYIGNNNIAQKMKNIYVGIDGVARQVQKGYVGVDGIARQFYQKMTIISAPSLSGSYTYNGSAQTPTFTNYNSSTMTIGGTYSATNAGTYTATFTPKEGYCQSDESTGSKSISWSIAKANGYITLSATSGTVNKNASTTFTVNSYSGSLSVSSSNTSYATCSINGTTVTISGKSGGSATITISVAASTNYNATSATYSVNVNYIWNKYNCNSTANYATSTSTETVTTKYSDNYSGWIAYVFYYGTSTKSLYYASSYTVSGSTFTAAGDITYYYSPQYFTEIYYFGENSTASVIYQNFKTSSSSNIIWQTFNDGSGNMYVGSRYTYGSFPYYKLTRYISSYSYSCGSTSYGTVASSSSSAYPSNGKSGDYWYVSA